MIGETIGSYHVQSLLGMGGMGEVYRARDTRLGREVAIKVLPASFTSDAERLARFEREARVLATLNHPHIAAIYGVEDNTADSRSIRALVLELVEGETLAERIARRPLGVAQALDVATQIASALDAAHEKGIVHRDLKPANIKITPEGMAKVLDFGIAKATGEGTSGPVGAQASTELASRGLTVLGTAAYMSPEQARGQRVDKRCDIWAFGCVLYEMLTGKPAFQRETVTDTLAHIVEHDPDWTALPSHTPVQVRELMRRCLEKDPRKRLRDIGDASFTPAQAPPPRRRAPVVGAAIAAAVLAAALLTAWTFRPQPAPPSPGSVTVRRLTDFVGMEDAPVLSPDGKTVAFVARADGYRQIWLRLLAGGLPLQITRDPVDHEEPRWSHDASSLIYFTAGKEAGAEGTVWEVSALGGEPRRLATAAASGDLSPDGNALAVLRFNGDDVELAILSRDGSRTQRAQRMGEAGLYSSVRWSPDGRWLAFQRVDETFNQVLFVVPAEGGELVEVARSPRIQGFSWQPDSDGIVYSGSTGSTMLYPPTTNLRAVRRDGTGDRPLTFGDDLYAQPDVNRAGLIVATRTRIESDLWRFPVDGSPVENVRNATRITRQTGQVQTVSVSPNGNEVAYLSDSGGHSNVWVARANGSGTRQITFEQDPNVSIGVPVWSSTGDEVAFIVTRGGATGLSVVGSDGGAPRVVVPSGIGASWSGDDRWLYYNTVSDGVQCIEKVPLPDGAPATTVRCDDAMAPANPPDGSALYYVRYPNTVLAAEVRRASPESADDSTVLARVALSRVPHIPRMLVPTISHDGAALAMPLLDGETTNIWVQPTDGSPMYPVTDFGERAVLIARRVAWSPDDRSIYAAVADVDSDVVLLGGLLP